MEMIKERSKCSIYPGQGGLRGCPASFYLSCPVYRVGKNCWETIENIPCCKRIDKIRCLECDVYIKALELEVVNKREETNDDPRDIGVVSTCNSRCPAML